MPLSPDLIAPIPGDNRAGSDLRYDPVYGKIKEARREDLDVPAGDWSAPRKTADWQQVIKLASEALSKRSKDLQLAVWLTEAWLRREGFAGLRQGLELNQSLLQDFWEELYPVLEDGDASLRAAPLSWLGLKLDVAVKMAPLNRAGHSYLNYVESSGIPTEEQAKAAGEGSAKEQARLRAQQEGKVVPEEWEQGFTATPKAWYKQLVEDLDVSLATVNELDRLGDERFGDEAPSFGGLRGALEEVGRSAHQLLARKLQLDPDPIDKTAVAAHDAPGGAVPAGGSEPGAAVGGAATPISGMDDAAARIALAARYIRARDATNPAAYLMLRGFRWGELRAGGDQLDPKLLAAPPTETRVRLKTLLLDRDWEGLLEAGEEVMATPFGRGWLDLQRYALTACAGLGSGFSNVANSITVALRQLLRDLPDLPALTLMDDTATANAETIAWLNQEILSESASEDGAAHPALLVVTPFPDESELRMRAIARARAGQPEKAIELLMLEAGRAKSPRSTFLRRTEATRIMVENGMESVALPILRQLAEQIDKNQLEQWEAGETIAQSLGVLYTCLHKLGEDDSELYKRICRLDPLHAIALGVPASAAAWSMSETEQEQSESY